MTIKTSRRIFLSGVGALATSAFAGPAGAQDLLNQILQSERRGNWDDTFDARASDGDEVASNLPIFSPQTVMYIEQAIGQYSNIVAQGGWPVVPATKKLQLGVVVLQRPLEQRRRPPVGVIERLPVAGDLVEQLAADGLDAGLETAATHCLPPPAYPRPARRREHHGAPGLGRPVAARA